MTGKEPRQGVNCSKGSYSRRIQECDSEHSVVGKLGLQTKGNPWNVLWTAPQFIVRLSPLIPFGVLPVWGQCYCMVTVYKFHTVNTSFPF